MFSIKAQETANKFKGVLNDLQVDEHLKQDVLAHDGGVKQNTISQWFSPESDRHLPAFQLLLQSEKIVVPLCRMFLERFNKSIVTNRKALKVNGTMDDNLLTIDIIQGEIIKLRNGDPVKVIKYCEQLEIEVATIKAEAKEKIK
jgi:hypothetical protein